MPSFFRKKKFSYISTVFLLFMLGYGIFFFFQKPSRNLDFKNAEKKISLNDNGLYFVLEKERAETVGSLLQEKGIAVSEHDLLSPEKESPLFPGIDISIKRAIQAEIHADGKTREIITLTDTVEEAIMDSRIELGEFDLVSPKKNVLLENGMEISITRVKIEEQTVEKPIDFKTINKEDAKLGWRTKKTEQKGVKGTKEVKYEVVSHDGKEISRKVLEEKITKEPTPEIIVQGTYMKLGKAQRGHASFYASSWGELNASRTIPRGGYAKVTNLDNGKTVIIKINDFGPRSPERIIDMSYDSFAKIGDLGQGILPNVKVEQVLN